MTSPLQSTLAALNVPCPLRPRDGMVFNEGWVFDGSAWRAHALALESTLILAVEAARAQERERVQAVLQDMYANTLKTFENEEGAMLMLKEARAQTIVDVSKAIRSLAAQPGVGK